MNEKEIIKRKIFLKRQLIELTEKEIEQLENSLNELSLALGNAAESVLVI
jgi:CTP-dependent riboflavin kinase